MVQPAQPVHFPVLGEHEGRQVRPRWPYSQLTSHCASDRGFRDVLSSGTAAIAGTNVDERTGPCVPVRRADRCLVHSRLRPSRLVPPLAPRRALTSFPSFCASASPRLARQAVLPSRWWQPWRALAPKRHRLRDEPRHTPPRHAHAL